MSEQAHMVKQTIHFSDGTETVINYRGVIVDGVLISEKVENTMSDEEQKVEEEKVEAETVEETVDVPSEDKVNE